MSSGRHETTLERELSGGSPMVDGGSLAVSVVIRSTSPGLGLNYRQGEERSLEDKASAWGTRQRTARQGCPAGITMAAATRVSGAGGEDKGKARIR